MKLNPTQLARLEIQLDRTKRTLRSFMAAGANQFGHPMHDSLMAELSACSEQLRKIGRNVGHTRNSLHVSKYKRENWNDRQRRQSHMHGTDRVEKKANQVLDLVKEIFRTMKQREDPNGGLFDLSKEIGQMAQDFTTVISVDVRNDMNTVSFQNADVVADPIQSVVMLVGLGLEMIRLYRERRKKDKEFHERNPNWS